jgi:two-component system response regulator YesN
MPHVVLVDDNIRAIEGLRRHLPWNECGCVCVGAASNGLEALEMCRRLPVDIVITDVRMPQMDGLELCARLRAEFPGIRLIVLSAYDDFTYAKNALAHGVENYLLKPIDDRKIEELAGMLRRIADSIRSRSSSLAEFYNSPAIRQLSAALRGGSAEEIDARIRDLLTGAGPDFQTAHEMAAHLVALIFQEAAGLGLNGPIAGRGLSESLLELESMHSLKALTDCVAARYLALHQLIQADRAPGGQNVVEAVKKYIQAHYADADITTYALARRFHISQSYLCQLYKAIEKTSINATITQLRIDQAVELMANPALSLQEIAARVGYSDAHYFTRVFKKVKGLAPSEAKKLLRHDERATSL